MPSIITDSYVFGGGATLQAQYASRKIYRHESNEGSVIEFDYWGTPMKLFVADAKYRIANLAHDTSPKSHGTPQLSVTTAWFNGSSDNRTRVLPYTKDDAWIQSTYAALKNDGTAKSNTDKLMAYPTTQCAHHCRNQNIPGIGQLDMHNLYELIILYLESDNIDALDPTVKSNRDMALGIMNPKGRFGFGGDSLWASTDYSPTHNWYINFNGAARYYDQSSTGGVAPVKELDV